MASDGANDGGIVWLISRATTDCVRDCAATRVCWRKADACPARSWARPSAGRSYQKVAEAKVGSLDAVEVFVDRRLDDDPAGGHCLVKVDLCADTYVRS